MLYSIAYDHDKGTGSSYMQGQSRLIELNSRIGEATIHWKSFPCQYFYLSDIAITAVFDDSLHLQSEFGLIEHCQRILS